MAIDIDVSAPVRVGYADCGERLYVPPHRHKTLQLAFSFEGRTRVSTAGASWSAGPRHSVCIPPDVEHELELTRAQRLFVVHLEALGPSNDAAECQVITLPPLALELVAFLAFSSGDLSAEHRRCLEEVVRLQIRASNPLSRRIVIPTDKRAARVARAIVNDTASTKTLRQWAAEVGACERTLSRIFEKQTGMTFRKWQRQCRMTKAAQSLAEGSSVADAAAAVGYDSVSAFIAVFQEEYGTTPANYSGAQAPDIQMRAGPSEPGWTDRRPGH